MRRRFSAWASWVTLRAGSAPAAKARHSAHHRRRRELSAGVGAPLEGAAGAAGARVLTEKPLPGLCNGGPHRWNPHNVNTLVSDTFRIFLLSEVESRVEGSQLMSGSD